MEGGYDGSVTIGPEPAAFRGLPPVEVVSLGELLIDFVSTRTGCRLRHVPSFEKAAGGAPANVAVGLVRLGVRSGFIGTVGADEFGVFLKGVLGSNGVDVAFLQSTERSKTALAFLSLTETGERDFLFYGEPCADLLLESGDVWEAYLSQARILHHGSISLIGEPARSATLRAITAAKEFNLLVSYDVNLRLSLWPDEKAAYYGIRLGLERADIVKVSEEELEFLVRWEEMNEGHDGVSLPFTGVSSEETGAIIGRSLITRDAHKVCGEPTGREALGAIDNPVVFRGLDTLRRLAPQMKCGLVTAGAKGCYYVLGGEGIGSSDQRSGRPGTQCVGLVPGYQVKALDTTGAGDGFVAGFLCSLLRGKSVRSSHKSQEMCASAWREPSECMLAIPPDPAAMVEMVRFANAVGALTTLKRGAIPALPTWNDVVSFMATGRE